MRALSGEREHPAHVLLSVVAHVAAGDRHPSALGVEEAEQEVRHRGLPGAARPDEGDLAAGIEPQVDAAEHGGLVVAVADGHVLEGDDGRSRRRGKRRLGIAHLRRGVRELEQPATGSEARGQLARRGGEGEDGVERGEREQRERRDEHAVERARVVRRDGHGQDADDRQAARGERERLAETRDERVATRKARELAVQRADAPLDVVLAAIGDELRRPAQQLDELGVQLARGGSAPSGGRAGERSGRAPAPRPPRRADRGRARRRPPGGTPP